MFNEMSGSDDTESFHSAADDDFVLDDGDANNCSHNNDDQTSRTDHRSSLSNTKGNDESNNSFFEYNSLSDELKLENGWADELLDQYSVIDSPDKSIIDSSHEKSSSSDFAEITGGESSPDSIIQQQRPHTSISLQESVNEWFIMEMQDRTPAQSYWPWGELSNTISAVGNKLSNVIESSLGMIGPGSSVESPVTEEELPTEKSRKTNTGDRAYGGFLTSLGSNLVTGSLDVFEALGKKAFEKLTVADQKSRRRFVFEPGRDQNLSEVLKELRESRTDHSTSKADCLENPEAGFIDYFEHFGGLSHLKGLELLSRNHLRKIAEERRREVETLFVRELTNPIEEWINGKSFTKELGKILSAVDLPYNGSNLMECDERCMRRLSRLSIDPKANFIVYLEILADITAESVHLMHKIGQLMLATSSIVERQHFADFLTLVGRRISFYSNNFVYRLSICESANVDLDEIATSIFLSASDAFSYVQQSLRLLRPLFVT